MKISVQTVERGYGALVDIMSGRKTEVPVEEPTEVPVSHHLRSEQHRQRLYTMNQRRFRK